MLWAFTTILHNGIHCKTRLQSVQQAQMKSYYFGLAFGSENECYQEWPTQNVYSANMDLTLLFPSFQMKGTAVNDTSICLETPFSLIC